MSDDRFDDRLDINTLGSFGAGTPTVTLDRAVLAEALEHIAEIDPYYEHAGEYGCRCCRAKAPSLSRLEHGKDCRYVRVSDALRKALGL